MPSITIKNIPPDLLEALKARAAENHRSLNGEAILALRRAAFAPRPDPAEILARADAIREALSVKPPATAAFIRKAIREGRP
jgi:plasmid stability protein